MKESGNNNKFLTQRAAWRNAFLSDENLRNLEASLIHGNAESVRASQIQLAQEARSRGYNLVADEMRKSWNLE
jgi:hypothetical protein